MSEKSTVPSKSMVPSRFIFCVIVVSMFLLVLSSIFLLQFRDHSFIPRSVFELILVNNTSFYFNPNTKKEEDMLSPFPSGDKKIQAQRPGELDCQVFKSSQKLSSIEQQRIMACDPTGALLRVFMYDLPPEFHFGILGWKGSENQTWPLVDDPKLVPSYPGGLNLQHSPEYWLTLDLLSSDSGKVVRPCTAFRVQNSSQADVIFVPFFSSLSYNRLSKIQGDEKVSANEMLQEKLVQFLMSREEWKRSGGKDHLIVAHHPNSMLDARRKLGSAILLLADFGRYPVEIANVKKDIIAPYKHVVRSTPRAKSFSHKDRPTLLYFQGAIYRKDGGIIRQELYYLLKDEKDVHFAFGTVRGKGIREASYGMALSKFCLNIAGDTPSSNRLFDAIASHCVPVIISDKIELPFEDILDYSDFCLFVRAKDAVRKGYLLSLLRSITEKRWTEMWERLKEITLHFEYQYPSQPGDAVNMIWQEVAHKVSSARFDLHRKNRYKRSQLLVKTD
ncbi:probable arabinosyltransferase ARAD1 [Neltuma alba]|uniref:probable arabinosyltransferase ARAD1 n=1 Tax=Neltuma alba TaxID=207710 RepID=UPI0010A4F304|nr:probable arabinosyltransferase ARAD1 [Prosopis alba]XP_028763454.1 probable arabinosyltransferase ARAD1 [Prosopis alba]XP_028763455.1 probable arabinosyltransferase ARAD1 [Prosopis alba]XP_028763456.1 probable arabinosyltransferase ARAD1 [Prosopis alba]XP_028763457.1 probable arabinosyltransferase ARAD1 [Prosopis alba]